MSDLSDLAKGLGNELVEHVRTELADEWEALEQIAKVELRGTAEDLGGLLLRSLGGEDVDEEIAHARAAMASWEFVLASKAQTALIEALERAVIFVARFVAKVVI